MKNRLNNRYLSTRPFYCHVVITALALILPALALADGPTALNDVTVQTYYTLSSQRQGVLSGFDFDNDGNLHFSLGDPDWGLQCDVYRYSSDGKETQVYASDEVFAGFVTVIGSKVYFNDGGDFMRGDYNFFMYDAAQPDEIFDLLIAPYGASLGSIARRHDAEIFGVGSDFTWGPAAFFYSPLNRSGFLEDGTIRNIGDIGESPGPMAFDREGNLYYAHGYVFSGAAEVFRWNAAEVNAALDDSKANPLRPDAAQWATLPEGYGATGMAADDAGNVFLTATAWLSPSRLLVYNADTAAQLPLLEYDDRLGAVRYREGFLYVNSAESIFRVPLLQTLSYLSEEETRIQAAPGEPVVMVLNPDCGIGGKQYQWYRMNQDKSAVPVGGNTAHYTFTATSEDDGVVFYCVVSDALTTVESSHFTVNVQAPVPVMNTWGAFMLVLLFGGLLSCRAGIAPVRNARRM